jgi:hypothetical protein
MPRASTVDSTDWLTVHDPLRIVPWRDEVVERFGHAPRGIYVETYWLPILGPSATWAMRRLTAWLDAEPDGYDLQLCDLGRELGLGSGTGRNASLIRTLARLVAFGMATPLGDALAVRRMLAPLTRKQVRSLPDALAARHDAEPSGVVQPMSQPPKPQPASETLCDTTSLVKIGNGTADRSGKPTAVPPPTAERPTDGVTR